MLNDFQRMLMGLPGSIFGGQQPPNAPAKPVNGSGSEDYLTSIAQPMINDDRQAVMFDKMGQMGALLIAAGQRMNPAQRGQILAQGADVMGNTGRDMMNMAQSRLMASKSQEAQQDLARKQDFTNRVKADPTVLQKLGITPEQYAVMGPEAVMEAMKSRMSRDPVQEAYMLAQIKQMSQPKWQITGQDEFGRPRYDLVNPGGDIITPGGTTGGRATIMDQLGNAQGPEALAKLKQVNPAMAAEVEGIVNARQPFPSRKLGTPEGAMLNSLVSLVDPTYNANTFNLRTDTQKDFQKSQPSSAGGQRQFGNVGLKHMAEIYNLADKLPDHTNWGPLNTTVNALDIKRQEKSAQGGDVRSYKLAVINGFDEIAKALGIGTGAGQQELQDKLEAAQGPAAIKQVIRQQASLLKEKLDTLQERWAEQMGPAAGNFRVISPEAEKALNHILSDGGSEKNVIKYDARGNRL